MCPSLRVVESTAVHRLHIYPFVVYLTSAGIDNNHCYRHMNIVPVSPTYYIVVSTPVGEYCHSVTYYIVTSTRISSQYHLLPILTCMRAHVPAQVLQRPEPLRTEPAVHLALRVVRLAARTTPLLALDLGDGARHLSEEAADVAAEVTLGVQHSPIGRVRRHRVLEDRATGVVRRVAQVTLVRQVDGATVLLIQRNTTS